MRKKKKSRGERRHPAWQRGGGRAVWRRAAAEGSRRGGAGRAPADPTAAKIEVGMGQGRRRCFTRVVFLRQPHPSWLNCRQGRRWRRCTYFVLSKSCRY